MEASTKRARSYTFVKMGKTKKILNPKPESGGPEGI